MKIKRYLSFALALCMVLTLALNSGVVYALETQEPASQELAFEKLDSSKIDVDLTQNDLEVPDLALDAELIDENQPVKVIIVMEGESIIEEDSTAVMNAQTQAKAEALADAQAEVVAEIEDAVLDGEDLDVSYSYTWLLNGVAAEIPYGSIAQIQAVKGVKKVLLQPVYSVCETETDAAASPMTSSDGVMIGRESAWANGYTGKGIKIAIIDTGLDTDHQNFQALDASKLTENSATKDTVDAVLESLNATSASRYSGLTVDDVYYNSKVAFGFNYCDNNLNITHEADGQGDHGTHVAGIAAANKVDSSDVVGVAPDAQLYIMKVFGENGGAYPEDILAALEDALILGADVVNMSLGSPAGFTTDGEEIDAIYNRVAQTNTVLSVSAGNNYNAGYANVWGTNMNLTSNPDNGIVGSPGTYANVLTVASVENWKLQKNYIKAGNYQVAYDEAGEGANNQALITLTGTYEMVVVPGYGAAADYEGLDVAGKVALVQRGVESFADKHTNAAEAGAVACVIYNNVTETIYMSLEGSAATIPCVSISMADGAYLVSALESDPGLKVSFPAKMSAFPSETAYQMSEFSSWGVAPDLSLEPDITAPGGNIYSTVDNGGYGIMSGTSMAAPNVVGMSALVMQYVKEKFGEETDYRVLVQHLLMSTAMPLTSSDESGLPYSPRSQGSGLANVYNAINTQAFLTVDGSDLPKVELGADPQRTGSYSFSFQVNNFGSTPAYYGLDTLVQTESYADYDGLYFMSGTPVALGAAAAETSADLVLRYDVEDNGDTWSHDAYIIYRAAIGKPENKDWSTEAFRYDLNGDEAVSTADVQAYLEELIGLDADVDLEEKILRVAAGETAEISVSIRLTDADKAYFDTYYANGGYVEGFTSLTALNEGGVDLSLPYLGFYGDWADAPVMDNGFYWDLDIWAEETALVGNQYTNILFTEFQGEEYGFYPGFNAYMQEAFDPNHVALSVDGDGDVDTISDIFVSLLRNASALTFRYTNTDTGEVYYEQTIENVSKSCYSNTYKQIIPFVYAWLGNDGLELYDWTDSNGNELTNNMHLLLEIEATGVAEGDEMETWKVPITIDMEAPQLLSARRIEEGDSVLLELTFRDNHAIAAVQLISGNGQTFYARDPVEDVEPDENGYQNHTMTFDITDISDKLVIMLGDYALNEAYYGLNTGGEGTPYGDLVGYQYNYSTGINGWVSFDADVDMDETTIFSNFEMDFVAAEYVNGFVYAQTENGNLYGFKYTDMLNDTMTLEDVYITQLENVYQDLAYNYSDGKLYGLLTIEEEWMGEPSVKSEVFSINIKGEYFDPDMYATVAAYQEDWIQSRGNLYGLALAIDDAGSVYILGQYHENLYDEETYEYIGTDVSTAQLWKASMEENYGWVSLGAFRLVGDTGMTMDFLQSMTWDHNSEKLYWARFDGGASFTESELIEVDPTVVTEDENGDPMVSAVKVGNLSGETCGLFAPLTEETAAKPEHANVPETDDSVVGTPILRDSTVTMSLGSTKLLGYDIDPWYSSVRDVVWSSSDEAVATVDQNGLVTAVGEGSAVITVAAATDETRFDSCTIEVSALTLKFEGVVSAQTAGIGSVTGVSTYAFEMNKGVATFGTVTAITAPEDKNYGLSLATSEYARGSIWACENGNTGIVYEIDPATGEVKEFYLPIDGDMMFGMHYSEKLDSFTNIMNFYLYTDLDMSEEMYAQMDNSYDKEQHSYMYHRINMLEYLREAGGNFTTGETGQGASSEILFCGITGIDGGIQDAYGDTYYYDTYKDYLGNWAYGGMCSYQPDQTLILLDNVGRLWYINEVTGVSMESDEWGNVFLTTPDGGMVDGARPGVIVSDYTAEDGTHTVFHITQIVETPLTDMFREGTMPRYTYHFSDIEFAGYTADGQPMFAMSLYDYWNNGTTNELYLYIPGGEFMNPETYEYIEIPNRLFDLGDTGEHNIIASIHSAEVTGGVNSEADDTTGADTINKLTAGVYGG